MVCSATFQILRSASFHAPAVDRRVGPHGCRGFDVVLIRADRLRRLHPLEILELRGDAGDWMLVHLAHVGMIH
jgi:hypothetical protein